MEIQDKNEVIPAFIILLTIMREDCWVACDLNFNINLKFCLHELKFAGGKNDNLPCRVCTLIWCQLRLCLTFQSS